MRERGERHGDGCMSAKEPPSFLTLKFVASTDGSHWQVSVRRSFLQLTPLLDPTFRWFHSPSHRPHTCPFVKTWPSHSKKVKARRKKSESVTEKGRPQSAFSAPLRLPLEGTRLVLGDSHRNGGKGERRGRGSAKSVVDSTTHSSTGSMTILGMRNILSHCFFCPRCSQMIV